MRFLIILVIVGQVLAAGHFGKRWGHKWHETPHTFEGRP